jgi:hypothetical protein
MSYWLVKRAYKPVIVSYDPRNQEIIVVNDLEDELKAFLTVQELELPGKSIKTTHFDLAVPNNGVLKRQYPYSERPSSELLILDLTYEYWDHMKGKARGYFLPVDPVNIDFPDPEIKCHFNKETNEIYLKSSGFAFTVKITSELGVDDNYFMLFPDEPFGIQLDEPPVEPEIRLSVWNHPEKTIKFVLLR